MLEAIGTIIGILLAILIVLMLLGAIAENAARHRERELRDEID